jgi:cell division protein FtsI (penicillin-binding protein 3)
MVLAVVVMLAVASGLGVRAFELQVLQHDFLTRQGDARHLRTVTIPAVRGSISDRHGHPLAISAPVESVWAHPGEVLAEDVDLSELSTLLGKDPVALRQYLIQRQNREFVYIDRHVSPRQAETVRALDLDGIHLMREYRRFYPAGNAAAHVVGRTNIDGIGQEGVELAYQDWLQGKPGSKRVLRDRLGRVVRDIDLIQDAAPGHELQLSIDKRLQYLAHQEIFAAVSRLGAVSGSVVMLDVDSGEVLAMVNSPSYNPNARSGGTGGRARNRAVTDVIEPGSVIKPFIVALALESGHYRPETQINTAPGVMSVADLTVRDVRDYGTLDVAGVLKKSSNIGVSKMALDLGGEAIYQGLRRFGFGEVTGSGFPGESPGVLQHHRRWSETRMATVSYGYGLSVTPLQLAQAYAAIASGGVLRAPSFITGAESPGRRVLSEDIAEQVKVMLETVVAEDGTGHRANFAHYRVAGKTGTARLAGESGYSDRYVATFAGFAPASDPSIVIVVSIYDPPGELYYGGQVAAPVFRAIAEDAVRILSLPPDAEPPLSLESAPALVLGGGQ